MIPVRSIGMLAFLLIVAVLASKPVCAGSPQAAAAELSDALSRVDHINLYFLSLTCRTGNCSYDRPTVKKLSSERIYRACGANCKNLMKPVIDHMAAAVAVNCEAGGESVLLELGDVDFVMYQHSDRVIRYRDQCFVSNALVREALRKTELLLFLRARL